jgi:hypothetical protein
LSTLTLNLYYAMNGLEFLDLVIGLIFIYLIYSIGASTLWEIYANLTHLRSKMLRSWVIRNFDEFNIPVKDGKGKEVSNMILGHPMIKGMSEDSNKKPDYISSRIFSDVIVDLVLHSDPGNAKKISNSADSIAFRDNLNSTAFLSEGFKRVFLQYIDESSGSLQKAKEKIAYWYDEAQERLSSTYKKNLQIWIFVISLILVGSTNADTINLASWLYNNNDAREAIAIKASIFVQDSAFAGLIYRIDTMNISSVSNKIEKEILEKLDKDVKIITALDHELKQTGIPLGWEKEDFQFYRFRDYIKKLVGLLLTALAVSMGAPFWFDILSKLSNLRSSGNKPQL